jgi:hypothetical protein
MPAGRIALTHALAGTFLFGLAGAAGCRRAGPAGPPPLVGKPGPSGGRFLEKRDGNVILTRAQADWASWDGRLALVVVSDFAGNTRGGGADSEGRFNWRNVSADGRRRVEWQWESRDGKGGPVTINGKTFDLSAGNLFLVTTKGEKAGVVQLRRDFQGDETTLNDLAANDPELKRFVAEADEP